jgi:hypothetical protein
MLHLFDIMLQLVIKYLYIRKMENKVFIYSKFQSVSISVLSYF